MEIQVKSADRNLLLELGGELDHHGARTALREMLRHRGDSPGPAEDAAAGREFAGAGRVSPGPAGAGRRRSQPSCDDQIRRFT